jgi:hypothetical protein
MPITRCRDATDCSLHVLGHSAAEAAGALFGKAD